MIHLVYLMTVLEFTFSSMDFIFALLYALPILFIPRFHHRHNIFILNICLTIIGSCIYFLIYFAMRYFDIQRLYASNLCILLFYAYNIAVPFAFVSFTIHRFCSIIYHTKPFFKTRKCVAICIASQ